MRDASRPRFTHHASRIMSHSATLRLGEALANYSFDALFFFGTQTAGVDQAMDGIEQFQPVLERWFGDGLPLVITALAREKPPFAADMLGIDLEFGPVIGGSFPTDFSLGHDLRKSEIRNPKAEIPTNATGPKPSGLAVRLSFALGLSGFGFHIRPTLATAMAAIPSSRPRKPRCSLVVALIPTRWAWMPRAPATFAFMAATWGKIFGAWAIRVASMLTILPSREATNRAASCKKMRLATPFQRGSVLGKKWLMSGSPSAPRRASQIACMRTS